MRKKFFTLALTLVMLMSMTTAAFAAKIVTPNGGRAILWRKSCSSGSDYVAYVSSGSPAKSKGEFGNGRHHVSAYGYNSKKIKGWYVGWINNAYFQP